MLAAAGTCSSGISYPYKQPRKENSLFSNIFAMVLNWVKSTRKNPQNPDEMENSFQDYLDGYFNSFDYYPVCTRHLFARNDAYALWVDFMKVAGDLSNATGEMIASPERFLALESISGEELEKRNRQAAKKGLERAIEQAAVGSDSRSSDST